MGSPSAGRRRGGKGLRFYAVVDAVHLLADRKKGAVSMNQEADAEDDDPHSRRERRFVWELSFSL
jgi:hypothetical protein